MYDGAVFDALPSHLIYELTASKALAGITWRMGANTAGVGVCFRSKRGWEKVIDQAGLTVRRYQDDP